MLGSGWAPAAELFGKVTTEISYAEIPGFGAAGVSGIRLGSDTIPTGNMTVFFTALVSGFGGSNIGQVFNNGKCSMNVSSSGYWGLTSDTYGHAASSAAASCAIGNTYHMAATISSGGLGNIYVNGTLSGSANQNTGIRAAGTAQLLIGNIAAGGVAFNGGIEQIGWSNDIKSTSWISQMSSMKYDSSTFYGGSFSLTAASDLAPVIKKQLSSRGYRKPRFTK